MSIGPQSDSSSAWTINKQWVEATLGASWGEAYEFFGRAVSHLSQEATESGELSEPEKAKLKEAIAAVLPRTVDEVTPFAVRYLWQKGLHAGQDAVISEGRRQVLQRYLQVSRLAGADWNIEELESRVCEILSLPKGSD